MSMSIIERKEDGYELAHRYRRMYRKLLAKYADSEEKLSAIHAIVKGNCNHLDAPEIRAIIERNEK